MYRTDVPVQNQSVMTSDDRCQFWSRPGAYLFVGFRSAFGFRVYLWVCATSQPHHSFSHFLFCSSFDWRSFVVYETPTGFHHMNIPFFSLGFLKVLILLVQPYGVASYIMAPSSATTFDEYVLMTGGHTGLGLGVTKRILTEHPNTKVGLILRSQSRQSQTVDDLRQDLPNSIHLEDRIDFFYADLSDQRQVATAALQVASKFPHLDKVFCNAGIAPMEYNESASGNELALEINALAHVILIRELTPLLAKTAGASVIVTTTGGMNGRKLDASVFDGKSRLGVLSYYPQAKLAALLLLFDMARDGTFHVRGADPGPNKTKMTTSTDMPWLFRLVSRSLFKDPSVGSGRIYRTAYDYPSDSNVWLTNDKKVTLRRDSISASDKAKLLSKIKP